MRDCTGFCPSLTRGSARSLTVAMAYWRYCVEAYRPSGNESPYSPVMGANEGGWPEPPPPVRAVGFSGVLGAASAPKRSRSFWFPMALRDVRVDEVAERLHPLAPLRSVFLRHHHVEDVAIGVG